MSETGGHVVECGGCGKDVSNERSDVPVDLREPCPACGSLALLVHVNVSERITLYERVDLKVKEGGRGKPTLELRHGDDEHRASGEWRSVRRVIDRKGNRYEERIVRVDGSVVRDVSEPLDQHRGHGSDTSRPKSHP